MVGRVGKVLGLQAESKALLVDVSLLARYGSIQEVAGIELHSWLRRVDLHHSPGPRLAHPRREHRIGTGSIDHEVVVVSMGHHELLVLLVNAGTDHYGFGEIHRSVLHGTKFTRGNESFVQRRETVSVDCEFVPKNIAPAFSGQIEVSVLREVNRRGLVGRGFVVKNELILIGERIGYLDIHISRVSFLAIFAEVGEDQSHAVRILEGFSFPHDLVESVVPAVQGVRAIVGCERVMHSFQREPRTGNTIRIATYDGAKVWLLLEMPDGRFRIYYTDRDGNPVRKIVDWDLVGELKLELKETIRQNEPGIQLARLALEESKSRVRREKRTGAIESGASKKTRIKDLFPLIEQDQRQEGRKSLDHVQSRWENHLNSFFGNIVAASLATDDINEYIDNRDDEGAESSTINRELAIVRRIYTLAHRSKPPKVWTIPYFPRLAEPKARQGFLSDKVYDALARETLEQGLWLRGMTAVGYAFGWRKSEVLKLQVCQLDFSDRTIRLDPGTTKNDDGRVIHMSNEVYHLLSACAANKQPDDFVFTREDGEPIRDFRAAWANACGRAGCPGLLFHDLRRTAARNLRRLGVSEKVIMRIAGWRSRAVFERYNIVDQSDLADAARRLDEKRERELVQASAQSETDTKTDISVDSQETRPQ
jgi:integrase